MPVRRPIIRGWRCEAAFYMGEEALLERNAGEAERLLRQARDTCPYGFVESSGAQAELKRMGK